MSRLVASFVASLVAALIMPLAAALLAMPAHAEDEWVSKLEKSCLKDEWSLFTQKSLESARRQIKNDTALITAKDYEDKDLLETDPRLRLLAFTWYSEMETLEPGYQTFKACYTRHHAALKAVGDSVMKPEKKMELIQSFEDCLTDFFRNTEVKRASDPYGPLLACYRQRSQKH